MPTPQEYHSREDCYFCGEQGALDSHHIVPKRHGGTDKNENLVTVCPTCHRKLETLYDKEFYESIGIKELDDADINEKAIDFKLRTPVEAIPGISFTRSDELSRANIFTVRELANADSEVVSEKTNLSEGQVSEWSKDAQQWRGQSIEVVSGISDKRAQELSKVGLNTVRDLARADPEEVAEQTNFSKNQIENWVRGAHIEMY
ncbi:HNH endonuclease [Haloarcula sp. JP-L23]|uniref:HNH endonuclease n=1 Tax=Haloarcula sp. JP-L23 TaxID=2716717 RepID=UPI00140F4A5E|nr:hypothetical protein G9465_24380 [Haloarcula sp. JP-L23]